MSNTTDRTTQVVYRGTGFYIGLAAILLFAVMLLILAVQNTQDVTVAFLGLEFTVPLFAVAIGAGLLTVILDELIGLVWRKQRRTRLEERAELATLRAGRQDNSGADPSPLPRADTPTGMGLTPDPHRDHENPPEDAGQEDGKTPETR